MAKHSGEKVERTCDVIGCTRTAERSISAKKVEKGGLKVEEGRGKVHLCKEHYKEYKRATKSERKLESLGY